MIPQGGSSSTGLPSCSSSSFTSGMPVTGQDHQQQQSQSQHNVGGSGSGGENRWLELRQAIRGIRNHFSHLNRMVPSLFTFRTVRCEQTGRSQVRLYFLSVARSGRETTLMFADLPDVGGKTTSNQAATTNQQQLIPRYPLIEPSFEALASTVGGCSSSGSGGAGGGNAVPSREEQLQWERKRLVTWGISSYEVHLDSGKFIFPACGSLFTCQDSGLMTEAQFPLEVKSSLWGARLNPHVCPWNSDLLAFASNGDIWVQHMASGHESQLTFVHKGAKSVSDDPLQAGLPAYVIQEEFHRYVGFWWQPKSTDGTYRILYEEVDESDVDILHVVSHENDDQFVQEFRYPRTGMPNAKSSLKMIQFHVSDSGQLVNIRNLHLRQELEVLCPWMEYLVRAGWTPDGHNTWIQCLHRRQYHLEVILIPTSDFIEYDDDNKGDDRSRTTTTTKFSEAATLIEETTSVWINVHDVLYFLPSAPTDDFIRFIWADERTGFRRLVLVTASRNSDGVLPTADHATFASNARGPSKNVINGESRHQKLNVTSKVPLTNGFWEVIDKQVSVDETRQMVYFTGMQQGPLEKHLYAVSLNKPGEVRQITANGYSHIVTLNKECNRFVSVYSSISTLTTCEIFALEYPENKFSVQNVVVTSLGFLMKPSEPDTTYGSPKLYMYEPPDRPEPLYCMVFKPPNMQPGVRYPTVLYVYGGPEVQMVNNSFKGMRHMRLHMLASQGYVVVVVDGRGSCHRGVQFESYIKGRMGTVEIGDQVDALKWIAEKTGFIDLSRVAIHGWSYGGYLSLMALAQRPDVFKIAIAGAPVTSWLLYDTAYTERYMDLPNINPQGYATGNVMCYINGFPNEENRLLIIHGLIDENVHFQHTSQLISSLVKAGKPYQLQIYPGERHSLRHLEASEHYETNLLSFLRQHL